MHRFRLSLFMLAGVLLLSACETYVLEPPSRSSLQRDRNAVVGEDIVVLVNSRDAQSNLIRQARRRGYSVRSSERLSGLGLNMLSIRPPKGVSRDQAIRELERLEPGATAGANHRYQLETTGERYLTQAYVSAVAIGRAGDKVRRYAHQMINWPPGGCEAATKVGLVDAQISARYRDNARAPIVEKSFLPSAPASEAGSHADYVVDLLVGDDRLTDVRVFNAAVVAEGGDEAEVGAGVIELVRAVDWLQAAGVRVVNMSLAGPYNKILDRAMQRAADLDMIVVAAAGNEGPDAPPRYPAAFGDVIAVTAVDAEMAVFDHAVRGAHIDLAAPGVDVYVSDGADGRYVTGTSIAAPFVTARIASDPKALAQDTVDEVRAVIVADARDIGQPGRDPVFGEGLVMAPGHCSTGTVQAAAGLDGDESQP